MRKLNKLAAMLLALVMVLGLTGTAFASEKGGYTDVPDWAKEYVDTVTEKGLIDGKTATTFAPNENMTRADLVTALYRLAGSPALPADAKNPFGDVAEDAAYRDAVVWANVNGIVSGISPARFDPNGSSQRQAIAKVLNGFAAWSVKASALTSSEDVISSYADAASVAEWGKAAMNWAIASEYITGATATKLDPAGTATRAQVAAILCRYMDDTATGDASKDDSRNGKPTKDSELLVISFGTSFNDNRVATIKAIEDDMAKAFADYDVRRGFTADIIIEHVLRRDGQKIDNVKEALDKAAEAGVKNLLVQPTHLMNGYEYGDLRNLLEKKYADKFETIKIGAPLLTSDADYTIVADALAAVTDSFNDGKTAICFMGHGTEAASNGVYDKMQKAFQDAGYNNCFVGTVEAHPDVQDVLKMVQSGEYTRVVLRPMMIVAGDHANNDMAGDEEDSWKTAFTNAGYEVVTEIKGMGEIDAIRQLLVDHAKAAELLSETKIVSEPNPENPDNADGKPAETTKPEETKPAEAEKPEAKTLADGTYTIDVESDSGMFKVIDCELTVKDGKMSAVLTLSGTGYDKMYVGTKAEAEKAAEGVIDYAENADGKYTFTVSVAELDAELSYAAHAVKSGKWFDRTLTFDSATAAAK